MTSVLRALIVVAAFVAVTTAVVAGATTPAAASTGETGEVVQLAAPKVVAGLRSTAATSADDPRLGAARSLGGADPAGPVTALHPEGQVLYVVADGLHGSRGLLRVTTTDAVKPVITLEIPLSPGIVPRDIVLDPDRERLYVARGTHSVVLDVAVPAAPTVIGRIADVMIAAHDRIELETIADPTFGVRTFLSITTDFAGGEGCRPGRLFVLDVSGRLQDAPIEIIETDVPPIAEPGTCAEPVLRIEATQRRLVVDWVAAGAPVRSDWAPYDITASFQASADLCRLVRL